MIKNDCPKERLKNWFYWYFFVHNNVLSQKLIHQIDKTVQHSKSVSIWIQILEHFYFIDKNQKFCIIKHSIVPSKCQNSQWRHIII